MIHDVSVCIVSYNTAEYLEPCIRSVLQAQGKLSIEVIVVDNASADGSADLVERRFPQVRLFRNSSNVYLVRANNQAIRASTARSVLILNADTEVTPNTLGDLLAYLDAHPEVAAVQPAMVDGAGRMLQIGGRSLSLHAGLRLHTLVGLYLPGGARIRRHYNIEDWDRAETNTIEILADTCMLVRDKAILQVGKYDERYRLYFAETDWCDRLRAAGWQLHHVGDIRIVHHVSISTSRVPKRRIKQLYACDMINYFQKKRGLLAAVVVAAVQALELAIVTIVSELRRKNGVQK